MILQGLALGLPALGAVHKTAHGARDSHLLADQRRRAARGSRDWNQQRSAASDASRCHCQDVLPGRTRGERGNQGQL